MLQCAQLREAGHQAVRIANGAVFFALRVLLIGGSIAPLFLNLGGILLQFALVKCVKFHRCHSCFQSLTGEVDQPSQLRLPQLQQPDLILQGGGLIEIRIIQNAADRPQREFQFTKQQDGLQPCQRRIVIQPVACFCELCGRQQPNGVIMVQRPDADARQRADFVNGHHGYPSSV